MQSSITTKGQTTIPKPIRDHLHLAPGDRVRYFINPNGSVAILPVIPATALKGMLKFDKGPASLEQMEKQLLKGLPPGTGVSSPSDRARY